MAGPQKKNFFFGGLPKQLWNLLTRKTVHGSEVIDTWGDTNRQIFWQSDRQIMFGNRWEHIEIIFLIASKYTNIPREKITNIVHMESTYVNIQVWLICLRETWKWY